jgi:8-oxo-dGTP pyrophosphatase MutT (NUDIX family)
MMQKQIILLNPENATREEVATWRIREAARGIVLDNEGKVALLHVSKNNYFKLPGGGIDEGEDKETAFKRECQEEIGCEVETVGELGMVVEWRKIFELNQTSYCYVGKIVGEKGNPNFTESELENGFEIVWLEIAEAYEKLKNVVAANFEGEQYIKPRDIAIMEEYLKSKN